MFLYEQECTTDHRTTITEDVSLHYYHQVIVPMKSSLRYYDTFKLRKFESLFYKIHIFSRKLCRQTKYSLWKYNIHIFSILGVVLAVPVLYVIAKSSSFLWQKIFEIIFAALYFYLVSSVSLSQIFKIWLQTGNINILILRGIFYSRHVQLESSFLTKKNQRWNLRHTLVEKLPEIDVAKY